MSQKKSKKRNPRQNQHKAGDDPRELQQTRGNKRFNAKARNLLYVDLVFLAACMFMEQQGVISTAVANVFSIIGAILLLVALYFQFGPQNDKPKSPKL